MNFCLAFVLMVIYVFRTSDFFNVLDLSPENLAEVQVLKALTEKLVKANQSLELRHNLLQYEDYNISFFIYTRESPSGTLLRYNQTDLLNSVVGFSIHLKTVFVIHGWTNSYMSLISTLLRDALLANATVNVISVDWSPYSNRVYLSAVAAVPKVGDTIAKFIRAILINYNYSADQIILVGHSLGAHIAGFAGKELNGIVGVIIGMDPAGPLYFKMSPNCRLSSGDAQYVQAIHTNALFLGVSYNLADADFWPNGGYVQPGCTGIWFNGCSHNRSYIYMAESIGNNKFYARECNTYSNYIKGKCTQNNVVLMGGLVYNTSATGVFYLNTT